MQSTIKAIGANFTISDAFWEGWIRNGLLQKAKNSLDQSCSLRQAPVLIDRIHWRARASFCKLNLQLFFSSFMLIHFHFVVFCSCVVDVRLFSFHRDFFWLVWLWRSISVGSLVFTGFHSNTILLRRWSRREVWGQYGSMMGLAFLYFLLYISNKNNQKLMLVT